MSTIVITINYIYSVLSHTAVAPGVGVIPVKWRAMFHFEQCQSGASLAVYVLPQGMPVLGLAVMLIISFMNDKCVWSFRARHVGWTGRGCGSVGWEYR